MICYISFYRIKIFYFFIGKKVISLVFLFIDKNRKRNFNIKYVLLMFFLLNYIKFILVKYKLKNSNLI